MDACSFVRTLALFDFRGPLKGLSHEMDLAFDDKYA